MPLAPGDKLGPYEILSPIGAGGMGEVYKARDARLDRSVAIKVLPEHIAQREDARARFEREARSVASLNHPHICVVHDTGPNYMVMEMIEGETLAARIEKGPIPLNQALTFATQIADALDRAHRAGVTHRDIKPQNIMLTRDGVKVLDFGLAKSAANKPGPSETTLTNVLTTEGSVIGTPQYMAPEQFEGKEADARCDIWAFGAVLYEMVTGRKAFLGKNYTSLVAAILGGEPAPMAVQPFTPSWLERLVKRCLQKDPEDRWQTMRDVVLELQTPPQEQPAIAAKSSRWPWAVAALMGVTAVALGGWTWMRPAAAPQALPMEFEIPVPGLAGSIAVSPDGMIIAWSNSAEGTLSIRSLDSRKVRTLPINAQLMSWSPDGKWLAFYEGGKVSKLEATGSVVQTVTSRPKIIQGLSWTRNGDLILGFMGGSLMKVSAGGGEAVPALALDEKGGEFGQRWPVALPDGEHVLYQSYRKDAAGSGIYLARLDGKAPPRRLHANVGFLPVEPNTLLIGANEQLAAVRFDGFWEKAGEPVVLTDLRRGGSASASRDGRVIAHSAGEAANYNIALYDRSGKKLETILDAGASLTSHLEMSRDGKKLLLERDAGNGRTDLWTVELGRNVASRLTFGEASVGPGVWSADGSKVYFRSVRSDAEGIYGIPSNGSGAEKLILNAVTHHMHPSPDGKHLVIERNFISTGLDIVELASGEKAAYLEGNLIHPQFSPDSRLVAYTSSETGRPEVYVQTFPAGGGLWQISTSGGIEPRWRADGKEIYFDKGNGTVMAASIEARDGSLSVRETKELFRFRRRGTTGTSLAVSPDGQLFAIQEITEASSRGGSAITVKLNWKLGK
jgi:eukaryotic-like serine/threonine-protein kinase